MRPLSPFVKRSFGPRANFLPSRGRHILAGLALTLSLLYAGATVGLFVTIRHVRGVRGVQLVDFLLPNRWARVPIAQGNHLLALAHGEASKGHLREALMLANSGLRRAPAHRNGRLLLARLFAAVGRLHDTEDALVKGLAYHQEDPRYLAPLFSFLLEQQSDERVVALVRRLLPAVKDEESRTLIALAGATANYLRGNYDDAENLLRAARDLAATRDGRALTAKIDWDRGFRDLALIEFRALAAAFPRDAEIHHDLVNRLRQHDLRAEARRASFAFQLAMPESPLPRIELLHAYREEGDHARVEREIEELLRDFPSDPSALLALSDFAASTGNAALAHRLTEHARARQLAWEPHALLELEARIVAGDFRPALEFLTGLTQDHPEWAERYRTLLDGLQAVAYFGVHDLETARLFLTNFLQAPRLRTENLLTLANRFSALNADDIAHQVLAHTATRDPSNQAALTRLVELEVNLNRVDELPPHLQRLAAMRRPAPDLLRVAQHKLGSDLFLFATERAPALDAVTVALEKNRLAVRL
jgi:hypothetical protein